MLFTDFNEKFSFHLEIQWRFKTWYRSLPKLTVWNSQTQLLCLFVYVPISTKKNSFTCKFNGDSKSDIVVYLRLLSEQLKHNFFVCCYSVIFAATLFFPMSVWSFDFLNFVFTNVVILVYKINHLRKNLQCF